MSLLEITVPGTAIPQGSKTAMVRNGRAIMYDSNPKLKKWRTDVTLFAKEAANRVGVTFDRDESLVITIQVFFLLPKTSKRKNPNVKPDADKLARSILDSLSDAGVWADDCQVIDLRIIKGYTVDTPKTLISIKSC
jgi:Holliday junction resolvase RusA-like endonuclease